MPRDADKKSSSDSSEEFTEADLKIYQTELSKVLPKEKVEPIINVFSKFTSDKTSAENLDGFVSEILSLYLSLTNPMTSIVFAGGPYDFDVPE